MSNDRILRSKKQLTQVKYKTIGEYFWKRLNQLDDNQICMTEATSGLTLTIGQLKCQANSIAVALIGRGVTKEDRIAFYGQNSIQHSVLRFMTTFLGLTFMPLSPTFEKYEVREECQSAGATIIISSAQDFHKFEWVLDDSCNNNSKAIKLVVIFDGKHDTHVTFDKLLAEGAGKTLDRYPHFAVNPDTDMFFLIHTSGSTGPPKCAMIPHRAILAGCQETNIFLNFDNIDGQVVCAMPFPCGHISGTVMIPMQVLNGVHLILFAEFTEESLMRGIEKYKINVLPAFPSMGRRLIEGDLVGKYDISSLKGMSTGGAAFPGNIAKEIIKKYGIRFREAYGMTEFIWVTGGSDPNEEFIPGNAGNVAPGCEVKIVDSNTGESLGTNQDGEICVRGNKLFAGYFNNEKATKAAFDENGWYRTGDIGRYDERERIFITDRLKEVVRIGIGNHYINISPVEIEQYLLTHPSIAEVAVVGVNNKSGTHWPRAYVVLKPNLSDITSTQIEKYVSDTLAYTKQLKGGVVFIDGIKRTAIGKVDRKYYRSLVKDEVLNY
ncbi:unnamed protein product [Medioppia subpectinata]|uniref:Uncharacterized protein n=1 Tax=Medioppia subpectinata TaxID=1979941 RepID=A0A7R9LBC1_9ACAR|nr:unnamed protein product [Medioppia subpectinata]CAG2117093.1 unnamed protein product [Medioppia subpectinata]